MTPLSLQFLGRPQLRRGTTPVAVARAKALALLLYLALTRQAQRREHLVDLLWPESLPQAARKNLRNTLWTLGDMLGPTVILQEGSTLRLAPDVQVDIHTLEEGVLLIESGDLAALKRAVALDHGPLAEGLTLHEAPEFEVWLATERERLAAITLRLYTRIIALERQAGRWLEVLAYGRRALRLDPLCEPVHVALIEAYARLGQRAQAVQQYAALSEALRRELDVTPLPETTAQYEALLAEPTRGAETRIPLAPPALQMGSARSLPAPAAPPVFVGRAAELAILDAESVRAARGEARVVLVTGDLGMGKTQLVRAWLALRSPSAVILSTYALETSEPLPFGPLLTLFRAPGPARGLLEPSSPLPQVWLAELARLLPEIALDWPDLPGPRVLSPAEERGRLLQAIAEALRVLARPLLILLIDDLHWADPSTLDALAYLVSQLSATPLLLLATARLQGAPERLAALSATWQRQARLQHLPLQPLSAAEGAALLAAHGASREADQIAAWLHQSGGNPYFLLELSRATPGDAVSDLAALIRARLRATISAATTQVLQAAAVLGDELGFATLQAISGRSEEETLDAVDELLAAGVLSEQKGGYRFVHPLVATAVLAELSQTRRRFLHRRVALTLERLHPQREAIAGRLASHWAAANETAQAAHYAELAARHALALTGLTEAKEYARQALALAPTPERELLFGDVLSLHGDEGGYTHLVAAREGFIARADVVGETRACLQLARLAFFRGELAEARVWLARAPLADAQREEPSLGVEAQMLAAGVERRGGAEGEAERLLDGATVVARAAGLTYLGALVAFERGNLLADRGDLDGARVAFEEALRSAETTRAEMLATIIQNNLAFRALRAGDLVTARSYLVLAQERAGRYAYTFLRQYLASTAGEIALAEGRLDEADTAFAQAYEAAGLAGNRIQQANVRLNQMQVALARGAEERARLLLGEAQERFGDAADSFVRERLRRALLAMGAPVTAV